MARGLGSTITTELAKDRLRFADLLELHFDDSANQMFLTNGPIDIQVDTTTSSGKTFAANGDLLSFDTISETGQARVNQVNFTLSGASNTITNLFLNNDYVDRRIVIYRMFYNNESVIIGTPVMLFDGEMTSFSIRLDIPDTDLREADISYLIDKALRPIIDTGKFENVEIDVVDITEGERK